MYTENSLVDTTYWNLIGYRLIVCYLNKTSRVYEKQSPTLRKYRITFESNQEIHKLFITHNQQRPHATLAQGSIEEHRKGWYKLLKQLNFRKFK